MFLVIFVILIFFFQLSLVYFSRFGINILFRRMASPGINGYFTASTKIVSVQDYLKNFPNLVPRGFPQHSRGHPPGSPLLLRGITYFFEKTPVLTNSILSEIPLVKDSKSLWLSLSKPQRVSAVFSAFFLHLLAALTIIPLYFLSKKLFEQKTAIKTVFLYSLVPSFSFFALVFDPIYAAFPIISLLTILIFLKTKKSLYAYFSGLIFCVSLFFSLSVLPSFLIQFLLLLLLIKKINLRKFLTFYLLGFFTFFIPVSIFGYNFLASSLAVIKYQMAREYFPWLLFNPYDFFVFLGVPISLFFIYLLISTIRKDLVKNLAKKLFISFWIIFFLLIILGISRGEVGRIWIPIMFLPVLFVSNLLNQLKVGKVYFSIILILLIVQLIIIEEFWVPIW